MANWQFHEEMKQLDKKSYDIFSLKEGQTIKGNNLIWRVETVSYDPSTNFKAVAYSNGKNLVFSFVGTENSNLRESNLDWRTNIDMIKYKVNKQFTAGEDWYKSVLNNPKYKKYLKYNTGHSAGGSEGVLFGKKYGVDTVTFNAYNVRDIVETSPLTFSRNPNIINYGISNDLTFTVGGLDHLGETYVFEGPKSRWGLENNVRKSHSLNMFPTLNKFKEFNPQTQYVDWDGKIQKIPQNFQNYLRDFSRLQPAKISDEINQPQVQGVFGGWIIRLHR
jgi:hypothetical protein